MPAREKPRADVAPATRTAVADYSQPAPTPRPAGSILRDSLRATAAHQRLRRSVQARFVHRFVRAQDLKLPHVPQQSLERGARRKMMTRNCVNRSANRAVDRGAREITARGESQHGISLVERAEAADRATQRASRLRRREPFQTDPRSSGKQRGAEIQSVRMRCVASLDHRYASRTPCKTLGGRAPG